MICRAGSGVKRPFFTVGVVGDFVTSAPGFISPYAKRLNVPADFRAKLPRSGDFGGRPVVAADFRAKFPGSSDFWRRPPPRRSGGNANRG